MINLLLKSSAAIYLREADDDSNDWANDSPVDLDSIKWHSDSSFTSDSTKGIWDAAV